MQAAQPAVPPGLPGTSASGATKAWAIVLGVGTLIIYVPITLFDANMTAEHGGHLPWPVVQLGVTTPIGVLVLTVLFFVVLGPTCVLFWRWRLHIELTRATDVTDVPLAAWPGSRQLRPRRPLLHAWLGEGRHEQALNLLVVALGILIALGQLSIAIASAKYGFGPVSCDTNGYDGCPPNYLLLWIPVAGQWAVIALAYWLRSRWLRRVEAISGVWLRYQDSTWMTRLYYIRPPGVTPEAATAALARFAAVRAVLLAQQFCIQVLVFVPYVVLASASLVLNYWLRIQWVPS